MAKTFDPAFQAAPFLGESSHDPIKFARELGERRREEKQKAEEKKEREIASGIGDIDKFIGEAKGWADQKNFQEIMKERQDLLNLYVEFSRSGMNLNAPKTAEEVTFNNKMTEKLSALKYKVDMYNENKAIFDLAQKQMTDPAKEELIDKPATIAKFGEALNAGDVSSMNKILREVIVTKPQMGDIDKQINSIRPQLPQLQTTERTVTDESTGEQRIVKDVSVSPEAQKETIKRLRLFYAGLDDKDKRSLEMNFENAKELDRLYPQPEGEERVPRGWNLEDFYIYRAFPQYKEAFSDKPRGTGAQFNVDVFGGSMKFNPGKKSNVPLNYGTGEEGRTFQSAYRFDSKNRLKVNIGEKGSRMFTSDGWEDIGGGNDVEAELVFYDSIEDEFVFRTLQDSNDPYIPKDSTISVPRSVLGNMVDKLPVIDSDGKKKDLIDVFGSLQKIKKNPFGNEEIKWTPKPYLPSKK